MKRGTDLQNHVFDTYISLRYGVAALALAFPFVVPLAGGLHGSPLKASLSDYFCESAGIGEANGVFAARTVFVGILFAVGAALYLYKGFSNLENYLLNVAGAGALLVALLPTPCGQEGYTLCAGSRFTVLQRSHSSCVWRSFAFSAPATPCQEYRVRRRGRGTSGRTRASAS